MPPAGRDWGRPAHPAQLDHLGGSACFGLFTDIVRHLDSLILVGLGGAGRHVAALSSLGRLLLAASRLCSLFAAIRNRPTPD